MAPGTVTIVELAAALGLSKTTVADALAGSGRVSESTRERVQRTAREMRYVSNRAARQLRTKTTGALALYIPPQVRNMSFYMPFAFGAADQAARYGYDLTLVAQRAGGVASWPQVDGAVVIDAVADDPMVKALFELDIPVVTAGDIAGFPADRVSGVIEIDHAKTCTLVLDDLKRQGASKPALIAPTPGVSDSWSAQVRDGYLAWCQAEEILPNTVTIPIAPTDGELGDALASVLSIDETDAIVFGWHDVANRGELQLERMGYGQDASIRLGALTSGTENLHGAYLTAVDLHPREFGASAIELLKDVLGAPPPGTVRRSHKVEVFTNHAR
jgi:DNA-binding LacI/PurR family transcriptional regulator